MTSLKMEAGAVNSSRPGGWTLSPTLSTNKVILMTLALTTVLKHTLLLFPLKDDRTKILRAKTAFPKDCRVQVVQVPALHWYTEHEKEQNTFTNTAGAFDPRPDPLRWIHSFSRYWKGICGAPDCFLGAADTAAVKEPTRSLPLWSSRSRTETQVTNTSEHNFKI